MQNDLQMLSLLQIASPILPVGGYSYSEGLEALIETGVIDNKEKLCLWIEQELRYGSIRVDAAVMLRAAQSVDSSDWTTLKAWNAWLSAARETEELRQQSWQMGHSLLRLLVELGAPQSQSLASTVGSPCNYAIAFGIAVGSWQLEHSAAVMGYLHSWASNLIGAGVKLIPLGQTAGQQLLFEKRSLLVEVTREILALRDEDLSSCGWGLALASMAHQTQYTRLFRS
ncbi:MAG: urease accessory protein UreF [Cyanobacteria bacterium QH_9_48_43]|jgi:urease accessory protein|nr:MAG: urease accessory protein UreF [Cyanobacteria bacterium QH_2_48_84]PSO71810.1 MAG: urease accessory protein UreF [Cyanobacteria bacterium QH_3_48_40]PSO86047.1 MAG: urease accessory protein UreF [Cyanobacteria bacterium QS_5_48_63]PSO88632.1 MAG: urease accessory protein UreF [Cyanobacteria bacterium QH_9_48_43]PSO90799.1 MAG: urease accessory protein UreF [Cyanobacteria bacterium QS_3_48_167]PSO97515.1 MAG: urease accessory protein UreF [Cyanobacteria bacterium SW_12_48_29]PSP23010.1 